MRAEILSGYGGKNLEKIGTLELNGNRLTLQTDEDWVKGMIIPGPYDFETEGAEAYQFIRGRFSRSSSIFIKEEK
jgi:hypothetical protein